MSTWRDKANERIAALCRESWYSTNHNKQGKRYKKHRPYSIPAEAQALTDCLRDDNEYLAKCIFVHGYNVVVAMQANETERE